MSWIFFLNDVNSFKLGLIEGINKIPKIPYLCQKKILYKHKF